MSCFHDYVFDRGDAGWARHNLQSSPNLRIGRHTFTQLKVRAFYLFATIKTVQLRLVFILDLSTIPKRAFTK